MKIFIPITDEAGQTFSGHLVPFDPNFLAKNRPVKEGRKPSNWLSDNDYSSACERLRANHHSDHRGQGVCRTTA